MRREFEKELLVNNNRTTNHTMEKVSCLHYWEWPISGDYAGFIQGRELPHIGEWVRFSLFDMKKLMEEPIYKPIPKISPYTTPQSSWKFPIPQENNTCDKSKITEAKDEVINPNYISKNELNNLTLELDFPLVS
ncbi:35612_t:CDS:2, partial [Gigaspora margarita]